MQSVDTLVEARWVLPVEPEGVVLEHHTVVIDDGRIGAILPRAQARSGYTASRTVALPGHVVLPGLVNAHTHAGMTLLRGFADDLPLMRWLEEHVWPAERTRHRRRRHRGRPPAERRRFPPTPRTRSGCRDFAVSSAA